MRYEELTIEGRNAVIEAFRSGKTIDKVFLLDGCQDGPIRTILREAKKTDTIITFVKKERLDQMSETGKHQGVIAFLAAYEYGTVEEMLAKAEKKEETPFLILLDNIEDPHNLGSIVRTANQAGAHGVIIPKRRAVGLTATVAKVTNLAQTMEELKKRGMWFVCGDMKGKPMYQLDLRGPIGVVIGSEGAGVSRAGPHRRAGRSEGTGVSRLVKEKCDFSASIPMFGDIDSLNASVAMGILSYEIVRQRLQG